MSPYDWQESIGHRAQYVESRLATGIPVAALSIPEGVLIVSLRRQSAKIFEVYDRLAMSAIGLQSDVEAIRTAAVEFCHREGFQRSPEDVTLKRTVAGLSQSLRAAFGDLRGVPLICQSLFAELGETPEQDRFAILEYSGDFHEYRTSAVLTFAGEEDIQKALSEAKGKPEAMAKKIGEAIRDTVEADTSDFVVEAALIERANKTDRKFRRILGEQE